MSNVVPLFNTLDCRLSHELRAVENMNHLEAEAEAYMNELEPRMPPEVKWGMIVVMFIALMVAFMAFFSILFLPALIQHIFMVRT